MRTRAGTATPGPWEAPLDSEVTYGYHREGSRHVATWVATCNLGDEDESEGRDIANAEYIASWHPLVALAVADWLETEAHMADRRGNSVEGQTFHALAVARAYLGTGRDAGKLEAVPGE